MHAQSLTYRERLFIPGAAAAIALAAAAVALLAAYPRTFTIGWLLPVGAVIGLSSLAMSRMFGYEGNAMERVTLGLPLGLGAHLPLFAVAAGGHWRPTTWGMAAIALSLLLYLGAQLWRRTQEGMRMTRGQVAVLVVLIAAGAAAVAFSGRDSDDWAYGAFIADSSADLPLMLNDPALGDGIPAFPRQVLNLWLGVLGVAGRATSLDVPVFLQDHLPVLLAVLAFASVYTLGSTLAGRPAWGIVAVATTLILTVTTTAHSQPGNALLQRITEDKFVVMLILAPAVTAGLLRLTEQSKPKVWAFGILAGLGLAAVHPVSFIIVLAGIGAWATLSVIARVQERGLLVKSTVGMSVGLIVPLYISRLLGTVGPAPGSEAAAELDQIVAIANAGRLWIRGADIVMVHPDTVSNALTLGTSALALVLLFLKRDLRTTAVAGFTIATLFLAFNPLVTPVLGELLGVGMVWRFTWLLPVAFAVPAAVWALRDRVSLSIRAGPVLAVILLGAIQFPLFDSAVDVWAERRDWFRYDAELIPVFEAAQDRVAVGDVVLAPNLPVGVTVPSYLPEVSLLAFRGPQGTRWHFPRERVAQGVAREEALEAFYSIEPGAEGLSEVDLEIVDQYCVSLVFLRNTDPRHGDADARWEQVAGSDTWTLFETGDRCD